MMSLLDSWVVVTIRPLFIIVLVFSILVGLVLSGYLVNRWHRKKIKTLTSKLKDMSEIASGEIETGIDNHLFSPNEAYLQFIYNISHEVANPLQSIQTNLDNMANCTPEDVGRWQQHYKIITSEIKRLSTLTENLRLLSRLETPEGSIKREPVNLKGVIEDVIMAQVAVAESKNVRLVYKGPTRPARVLGDRDSLRQVILNLVDNGVKFSKEGGGKIIVNVQEEPEFLWVRVIDDGIGILEDDLPYIFDTAYRAPSSLSIRQVGSGLGLAIVRRIVDQHGGDIRVHSSLGEGTTISIKLPKYNLT